MADTAHELRLAHGVSPWQGVLEVGRKGRMDGAARVRVRPVTGREVATVLVRRGGEAKASSAIVAVTGLAAPGPRQFARGEGVLVAWDGPGRFVVRREGGRDGDTGSLAEALASAMGGAASVVDQSHGAALVRFGGPAAVDVLMRGTSLDVENGFPAGAAALVNLGHMAAHLIRLDDGPNYEVQVFRSMAGSFATWLLDSAAQFGIDVEAPSGAV
ncbi:MAG: hypothetical protein GC150_01540 [Rhizobiales bacterium]|nr:hypothetical protein [Hyphomicrobiales bacterium]